GTYEMTELGAALLVFLALAITHRKDEHITIDFVVDLLPTKVRHIINGIVELIIVAVVLLMSQHIFNNGVRMMERKTTTTDLSIIIYYYDYASCFCIDGNYKGNFIFSNGGE